MSSPRLRRLAADYEAVRSEYSGHPHVDVRPLGPLPPEAYRLTFRLSGLVLEGASPQVREHHEVEMRMPLAYPREPPLVVPLRPIFHPNVSDHFCLADYWSAGEPLADVIAKVGDMIQWRIYNVRSPLDAKAAYWAQQNPTLFPIGDVALRQGEVEVQLRGGAASASRDGAAAGVGAPPASGDDEDERAAGATGVPTETVEGSLQDVPTPVVQASPEPFVTLRGGREQ